MDWENETYVRVYVRDTITWKRLGWEGTTVLMQLLRKMDRAGVLDLSGVDPYEAVELVTGLPEDVVRVGLDLVLKYEVYIIDDDRVLMPNYIPAQEAISTNAKRQREHRAKKLAKRKLKGDAENKLYFIQAGDGGPIKIGSTTGPIQYRLKELQTANPNKLVLLGYNVEGDQEERLHTRFEEHQVNGEWFHPVEDLLEYIRENTDRDVDADSNDTLRHGVTNRYEKSPTTQHNTTPHTRSAGAAESEPKKTSPKGKGLDVDRLRGKRGKAKRRKKGGATPRAAASPDNKSPADPTLFQLQNSKERSSLIKRLDSKPRKAKEKATLKKLLVHIEDEVLRVYRAKREKMTGSGYIRVAASGRKAAREIGVACIGYGVTPEQVMDYWANPDNSGWTGMKFPPLGFLGSEKNMDRAVCSIKPSKTSSRTRGPVAATRREDFDGSGDDFDELMGGRRERRTTRKS